MSPLLTLFIWGKERGEEQKVANWQQSEGAGKVAPTANFFFRLSPLYICGTKVPLFGKLCAGETLLANCKVSAAAFFSIQLGHPKNWPTKVPRFPLQKNVF